MPYDVPSIKIKELIDQKYPIIDVRTPGEFAEFHIPGAVNVPIFTNDERAEVGTLYTQKGAEYAKDRGIEIVSGKLPDLYRTIKNIDHDSNDTVVIHCWRGGMRSRTVVSVMQSLGIPCYQLEGGIRAFRKQITNDLHEFAESTPSFIVLEGLTGTRKTDILLQLQSEGYPVLDLEGMAGHRGSAFGAIGLQQSSQKMFECQLWQRLRTLKDASYMIIEGESKRIGNVGLPDFILERKQQGRRIHITYPFQKRIQSLCEDYHPDQHEQEIKEAIARVEKRINNEARNELNEAESEKDYTRVVAILLEYYYDPRYRHSHSQYDTSVKQIDMENFNEGINKVKQTIKQLAYVC